MHPHIPRTSDNASGTQMPPDRGGRIRTGEPPRPKRGALTRLSYAPLASEYRSEPQARRASACAERVPCAAVMADVQPLRALHYDLAQGRLPRRRRRAALRRHRRRAARRPGRALALQRRRDRPARGRATTPTPTPPSCSTRWRAEGAVVRDDEPALWALTQDYVGPDGGSARPPRLLRRVRVEDYGPGPHPPARAHAPRPQGGPPAPDPRDEGEPLPHLLPVLRPVARRLARARAMRSTAAPWGEQTDDDGTVNRLWRVADPEAIARGPGGARRRRAADRRRPPPLRDGPRLRRGDRRRGRAPLRAHVPRRARGPGAHRVPHPPAASTASGVRDQQEALARRAARELRRRGDRARRARPRGRRARSASATSTPTSSGRSAHAQGPGDRRPRAAPTSPSPTAGSTPRCSRR